MDFNQVGFVLQASAFVHTLAEQEEYADGDWANDEHEQLQLENLDDAKAFGVLSETFAFVHNDFFMISQVQPVISLHFCELGQSFAVNVGAQAVEDHAEVGDEQWPLQEGRSVGAHEVHPILLTLEPTKPPLVFHESLKTLAEQVLNDQARKESNAVEAKEQLNLVLHAVIALDVDIYVVHAFSVLKDRAELAGSLCSFAFCDKVV